MGFKRTKEDFICFNCKKEVKGSGYTDHCPNCLYSRHVDVVPGDRSAECQGIMKPTSCSVEGGNYWIHYECEKCGYSFRVRAQENDNFEVILKLANQPTVWKKEK